VCVHVLFKDVKKTGALIFKNALIRQNKFFFSSRNS
jgi:hypothetical protein